MVFRNTVAAAPWTVPSHASMFSGVNAHRHGANYAGSVSEGVDFLAEYLRGAGYSTMAVTGGGYIGPEHGFARGFDEFSYYSGEKGSDELESGIEKALDLLRTRREAPFFLFFHTFEVHTPYRVREPYFRDFAGEATQFGVENRRVRARRDFRAGRHGRAPPIVPAPGTFCSGRG